MTEIKRCDNCEHVYHDCDLNVIDAGNFWVDLCDSCLEKIRPARINENEHYSVQDPGSMVCWNDTIGLPTQMFGVVK